MSFIRKSFNLRKTVSVLAEYKNQQTENISSIYINNNLTEKEIKKNMPRKTAQKNLYINITKEVKDLYKGNFKTLKKKIRKVLDDRISFHAAVLTKIITKIAVLPKAIYRFNALATRIPKIVFTKLPKKPPRTHMKIQNHIQHHITSLTIHYIVIVTKPLWYLHKNGHVDQWKIIDVQINSHIYGLLIFLQRHENMHWRKK